MVGTIRLSAIMLAAVVVTISTVEAAPAKGRGGGAPAVARGGGGAPHGFARPAAPAIGRSASPAMRPSFSRPAYSRPSFAPVAGIRQSTARSRFAAPSGNARASYRSARRTFAARSPGIEHLRGVGRSLATRRGITRIEARAARLAARRNLAAPALAASGAIGTAFAARQTANAGWYRNWRRHQLRFRLVWTAVLALRL